MLTPLDIKKKEFKKVMRGCDPLEVEVFLEELADYTATLIEDKDLLIKENERLLKEVSALRSQPILSTPIISPTHLPGKEAELIIREAELKALEILERTRTENNRLKEDVISLKQHKLSLIKKIKHILTTQIDLIEVLNIEEIDRKEFRDISENVKQVSSKDIIDDSNTKIEQTDVKLDLSYLKSSVSNENDSIPFIKQKAQEILNSKQDIDSLSNSDENLASEKNSFDLNNFLK